MTSWITQAASWFFFHHRLKANYFRQTARWLRLPNYHVRDNVMQFTSTGGVAVTLVPECNGVRITGHPNIAFHPRHFDARFLVSLLVRNHEAALGAWQLVESENRVWCNFSVCVPVRWATKRVLKRHIEGVLSETENAASRYRTLGSF